MCCFNIYFRVLYLSYILYSSENTALSVDLQHSFVLRFHARSILVSSICGPSSIDFSE